MAPLLVSGRLSGAFGANFRLELLLFLFRFLLLPFLPCGLRRLLSSDLHVGAAMLRWVGGLIEDIMGVPSW